MSCALDMPDWCPDAVSEQLARDKTRDDFFFRLRAAVSQAIISSLDMDLRSNRRPGKVLGASRKKTDTNDD